MRAPLYIPTLLSAQLLFYVSALTAQPSITSASDRAIALTAEQVVNTLVQRNLERAQALSTYEGTRVYRLEYRGFPGSRSAEMIVAVSYRPPRTKEFTVQSENGSRLIIERVFHKLLESEKEALNEENQSAIALNRDNYRFALLGYDSMPSGPCYILSVEPLTKNKLLYRGRIGLTEGTLQSCELRHHRQKILRSGPKKRELNRRIPRWVIFGFPSQIEAAAPFAWRVVLN